ncbi:MAG: AsmA-like C-terminal region-containing protein [Lysobacterales bacterium]|jgi:hypothetical protein
MKRFFTWLLAVVVLLAAGFAIVLYNPNLAKGPLERHLSKLTGYPLSLHGDLSITLGRTLELSIEDLRVAAPGWSVAHDLLAIGSLELSLDAGSLFESIVVVRELDIDELEINLETNADGEDNWLPGHRAEQNGDERQKSVLVNFANVSESVLHYRVPSRELQHVFRVVSLQQRHLDGILDIVLEGFFNGRPADFTGSVGPYLNLKQGREINFEARGHFGNIDISGQGVIDDPLRPRRPQFDLVFQGPDIDEVTAMLGADDLGSGVFFLHALGGEAEGHYEASINGAIGDVSVDLSMQADNLASLGEFDLHLAAEGPNLGAMMRVFGIETWPDEPFSINGNARRVGSTLNIPGLQLDIGGTRMSVDALLGNFPVLGASRVRLSVIGDDIAQFRRLLGLKGVVSGPFELHGRLDVSPEEVELIQVDMTTALGSMTISGVLTNTPGYRDSRIHISLEGNNAHELVSVFGVDQLAEKPYHLEAHIVVGENGLLLERNTLLSIDDEHLGIDGFVSFNPRRVGTDIKLDVNGRRLDRVLNRLDTGLVFAGLPYAFNGRIRVLDEKLLFEDFQASFADVELAVDGFINLLDNDADDEFAFRWRGDDFTAIDDFVELGFSMDAFVPGQPYQAHGVLSATGRGWALNGIEGHIGDTTIAFSGLVSEQADYSGTFFEFSMEGPDLHGFVVDRDLSDLPLGAFATSGRVSFHPDNLRVSALSFAASGIQADVELGLGLPFDHASSTEFDIRLRGDDIRHLFSPNPWFEPARGAYRIEAAGNSNEKGVSIRNGRLEIGRLDVSMQGQLHNEPGDADAGILFHAHTRDLSSLGRLKGFNLPALPLDLQARLIGNTGRFTVDDLTGLMGESDISGSMDVDLEGVKPAITANVESGLLDLRPLFAANPKSDRGKTTTTDGRLIPATPLPLGALNTTDAFLSLAIGELRLPRIAPRDLSLEMGVSSGNLHVPRLTWTSTHGGRMDSSFFVLPTAGGKASIRVDIKVRDGAFGYIGLTSGEYHTTPKMDVILHAESEGENLRELAGSMNGRLFIGSSGGTLPDVNLGLLDTFILDKVFKLVFAKPDNQDDHLALKCAAAAYAISDGMVRTDPACALTTDKINLAAKGWLDLKTEAMHVNFNVTPRNILKISPSEFINPYILVSGTLAEPKVGVDPAKALIHGGAAVGTSGLSVVAKGLLDRVGVTQRLCEKILEENQLD